MSLYTWRDLVHPRLGLLVGSRDEELEAAKHVFLTVCAELRKMR